MEIAICGKPSSGKSSFFKAATMIDVPISSRPFTTIKPNVGVCYVTVPCPCQELKVKCSPKNSQCINGTRLVPVKLWDIAGLIPGAHEGKGLGNKFLSDIIQADMLIHIVDASGKTDAEGNATDNYDPAEDVGFLENEIVMWFASIIKKNLEKIRDKQKACDALTGLGIRPEHVEKAINKVGLDPNALAKELRFLSKPILIAANKMDLPCSEENLKRMKEKFPETIIVPCSAEAEITLRMASKADFIDYIPGKKSFEIKKELSEQQKKGLETIRKLVLERFGSTGVQDCLNKAVFDFMDYIAVYPVENESKLCDKKGNVLPDVILLPRGSTALDMAYKVHSDIGDKFIGAIDAKTKRRVSADYVLENGDILSIQSRK
ncbi:MAG: redox-regulated ATPase YchF [Candidatus Aenigmarchaeota archaeon]|nr:redox-regulated ATPase YchF [Candidatus Aenigmarchaeota archaeon]